MKELVIIAANIFINNLPIVVSLVDPFLDRGLINNINFSMLRPKGSYVTFIYNGFKLLDEDRVYVIDVLDEIV